MAKTQQDVIEAITDQAMEALRGIENDDVQKMIDAYDAARQAIEAKIEAAMPGKTWGLLEMQGGPGAQLLQGIDAEIQRLMNQLVTQTSDAAVNQFQGSQAWSAYTIDQATPPNISANFTIAPTASVRALVNTPFAGAQFSQRYGAVGDAMASDIRDQLVQSMINGESMDDAAERVRGVMGDASKGYGDRSLTIARTEIIRAQALGSWDTYQNQNADLMAGEPAWHAASDDRLCPWCLSRDGKSATEIKAGKTASARGKSDPHGTKAVIPLHPRCRCGWMPRLKSWKDLGIDIPDEAEDDARVIRGADGKVQQVSVQTFKDWQTTRGTQLGMLA